MFEGSVYAGDTRVLDVQPNEERLVSYAIDLGTEVDPQVGPGTQKITSVKAVKGIVTTVTKVTEEKKYKIINRSQTDRTLLIEHPNRTNQQFKLVDTDEAGGGHAGRLPLPDAGEGRRDQDLHREGGDATSRRRIQLTNNADDQIRYFINLTEASPALKQKLEEALKIKGEWDVGAARAGAGGRGPAAAERGPGPDPQEPARDAEGSGGVRDLPEEARPTRRRRSTR